MTNALTFTETQWREYNEQKQRADIALLGVVKAAHKVAFAMSVLGDNDNTEGMYGVPVADLRELQIAILELTR